MNRTIKICLSAFILLAIVIVAVWFGVNNNSSHHKLSIVTTNFPAYDFTRIVTRDIDGVSVEMLLPPGVDLHTYEPTPSDIRKIADSDLFIYGGGESDKWADEIIATTNVKSLSMLSAVSPVLEETPPGGEASHHDHHEPGEGHEDHASDSIGDDEHEYDEHVWTSFTNATKIVSAILDALASEIPEYRERLKHNAEEFQTRANALKEKYQNMIASAKRKTIVFGDKFPLRYFADEMGLSYYAAFPGCAEETEASPQTIARLIDTVKSQSIPIVFKIELSSGNIAETIAKETGAKVLEFNTIHNVSPENFDRGASFLDIMEDNYLLLEEALNK